MSREYTTRPVMVEDLDARLLRGHEIAHITAARLVDYPTLGQRLFAALVEAQSLDLDVTDGTITIPLTPDEEEQALAAAQRRWDHARDTYEKAAADPSSVRSWERLGVNEFAAAEGLPKIDWTAQAVTP